MIKYVIGDLFSAPEGSVLAHACNCQGVWGNGIAKQFKERFPIAFKFYEGLCHSFETDLEGMSFLIEDDRLNYKIACLLTSTNYGSKVDSPETILKHTRSAIRELLGQTNDPIHMPKINSGLFNVPWEETEKVLNEFPDREFIVYSLE